MKNLILIFGMVLGVLFFNTLGLTAQTYTVTLESDPAVAAYSMQGDGSYEQGTMVQVNTTGLEGWMFQHWTENGVVVSEQSNYAFVINSNRHLVAHFVSHVRFTTQPEFLDFGEVPVGGCAYLNYDLINNPPLDKQFVYVEIIAPEGFETVHTNSYPGFAEFSDTTYHGFYIFYGETFTVKFCPLEAVEYSGNILNIHTEADTLYLPVSGTGVPSTGYTLDLTIILEGAYTPGLTEPMHTILNDNGLLPQSHPFSTPLPYFGNFNPVWYFPEPGPVIDLPAEVSSTVVDWVLVEVRDAFSAEQATPETIVGRQAALLLNTGEIIHPQGGLPSFDIPIQENLYVVVYHRNHLPVMSTLALTQQEMIYSWDFTSSPFMAYLGGQKQLGTDVYGMYGGDGDANGQVQQQDKNNVWNIQAGQSGYLAGDFNLDGQVQNQDKTLIWEPNTGIASQLPGLTGFTQERIGTIKRPNESNPF